MADYKVSEDVAQAQLDAMEAEFGPLDPANAEVVFESLRLGLVDFDGSEGTITYMLQKPPEGGVNDTTMIVFHEPNAGEMEKIAKGIKLTASKDGSVEIDSSRMIEQAIRLVTVVGKWPLGIAERITRRDLKVIQALSGFFV